MAPRIRHFHADRGLAGDALDQDGFRAQRQTEVVGEAGDAAVLDARFGLVFIRRDHRAGIDLSDLALDVELLQFEFNGAGACLHLGFLEFFGALRAVQQIRARQAVGRRAAGNPRLARESLRRYAGDFRVQHQNRAGPAIFFAGNPVLFILDRGIPAGQS